MSYANDNLANATVVTGASGSISPFHYDGLFFPAGNESGEDYPGAGETLWWKWTAPSSGDFAFDVLGSPTDDDDPNGLDTKMQVFSGPASSPTHAALTWEAANDDNDASAEYRFNSQVIFTATAGTTYYIQVDQFTSGQHGTIHLAWGAAPVTPVGYWTASPGHVGNTHYVVAGDVITVTDISTAGVSTVTIGGGAHSFTVVDSSTLTITVTSAAGSGPILIDGVPVTGDATVLYPSRWYTPPPMYARSHYADIAAQLPPERIASVRSVFGEPWSDLVEALPGDFPNGDPSGTHLTANDPSDGNHDLGQSFHALPLQAAWDDTYTYTTSPAPPLHGSMPPYSDPPDPSAPPDPTAVGAIVEYEGTTGTLTSPLHARIRLRPQTLRTDAGASSYQGLESITVLELPSSNAFHPANNSGNLVFVPRTTLLSLNVLWQGVPVNDVTLVEPDLTLPTAATDSTSVLVVPTQTLSLTGPTAPTGGFTEAMHTRPEVEVRYQGPRYRLLYTVPQADVTTIPPLRQWPRDDGLRRTPSRSIPSSRQGSLRRGPRGTYT